jgi:hypothetical protein
MHLLLVIIGAKSNAVASIWGGIVGDLGLFTGLGLWLRHRNCHVSGCWRLGRLPTGRFVVCHRHHPLGPPQHADILAAHQGANPP